MRRMTKKNKIAAAAARRTARGPRWWVLSSSKADSIPPLGVSGSEVLGEAYPHNTQEELN